MSEDNYSFLDAYKPPVNDKTKSASNVDDYSFLDTYTPPEKKPSTGNLATDALKAGGRGLAKLPDAIAGLVQTGLSDTAIVGDAALGNMDSSRISPAQAAIDYGAGTIRDNTTRALAEKVAEELPYSQETIDSQNRQQAEKAELLKQIDIDTPKVKSDGFIQDFNANNAWRTAKQLGAGAISSWHEKRSLIPSVLESIPEFIALAAGSKGLGVAKGVGGLGDASVLAKQAKLAGAGESVTADVMAKHAAKTGKLNAQLAEAKLAGDTALESSLANKINKADDWAAKKQLANNAETAANRQNLAIAGLGNFTLEGQGAADSAMQQFNDLPDEELRKNPEFVNLENQYGFEQAKKIASEAVANKAYAPAAAIGSVASFATGGGFEGALMRGFKDIAKDGIIKSGLKGGLKEGSEEFIQGGSGKFAENVALNPYTGVDLMEGVAADAGEGFAMGALTGGAGNAAGVAYNKAQQTKAKANELAEQAANTNGLSGAALTGQSAQLNADADAQLTQAQQLQGEEAQPITQEPQLVSPFKPLTQDIHAQVSNTLAFANEAIKNTKAGSDVKFKDKDATAIKTAADNLGIDLFNIDGTEKLPAQLVTEANTRLADYNVASIKPDVIDNAKNVINDIDFTTPLTPKESNSLRAVASDLGIQHDPARPELTLPKIQKTVDLHTKLNAKSENTTSPTATDTGANGRVEQNVQPDAGVGIADKEQPAPVGSDNTAKPTTPVWITRHLDSNAIKNPNNFGNLTFNNGRNDSEKLKEANDFIAKHNLTSHVAVKGDFGGYEIHNKKFAEANKQKQDSEIPDALKPGEEFADKDAIKNLVYNNLIKGENNNAYVNEKGVMVRHESRNPDWYKNGAFKLINPVTGKENEKAESVERIYNAVDRYHKGEKLIGNDHAILQKLSDILTEDELANSFEQEDTRSDEVKAAHKFIDDFEQGSYQDETSTAISMLHEIAYNNGIDPQDYNSNQEVYDKLKEITGYNERNARNETTDTSQPDAQGTGEDTADTANNGVPEKETVTNDDTDKQANKAQDDQSANEAQKATTEEVDGLDVNSSLEINQVSFWSKIKDPLMDDVHDAIMQGDDLPVGYIATIVGSGYSVFHRTNMSIVDVVSPDGEKYRITVPTYKNNYKLGRYEPIKTTSEKADEAITRNPEPVEEAATPQDSMASPAESGSDANTQSNEPTAKSEQNAVSPDNVELPDDLTTFVNATRDGKWTAKEFNAELTKLLTDHQINERIQFEKMDVSPEQTAAAVFQELGFDTQKVKAVEALSEALANNAESRIKNENLIKASVIELKTMLDDGEITQAQFDEFTQNALKTANVRSKKADAALSALRQEAKAKGLGDFTKKTDSNYSVHVQPNPSTAKSLAEQAKNEVSDLSAAQLGNKIAEAKKQLSLLGKAFEQLKRIFHLLFSSNKAIANENTFTPIQWVSKDGKTVFTVQKVPKSFEFFDSKKDSPEAQAIQAKMDEIIADDERRQRLEFNTDGTKGETFVFDDSQLGNNPILKTLSGIVKAANKRVPLKGLDDVSQTNIQGFIESNALRIGVLNVAIDRANLAIKDQPNAEPQAEGKKATGVIQLLLGNKTSTKTPQYRGLNLSLIKENGKTFITVGQSRYLPDIEIDIGRKSPLKSVLDKIDKQIDTLMDADLNDEIATMQDAISDLEQTNNELIRVLRDQKGFEQYKIGQAKKAQEARWINQQQPNAEPDAKPDVKPSESFTKKQIIDIINNPQESDISGQSSSAGNLYTEIKVGDDFVLHAQLYSLDEKNWYSVHIGFFENESSAEKFANKNKLDNWYEGESENNYFARFFTVEDIADFLINQQQSKPQQTKAEPEQKPTPANKPMAQADSTANKSDADKPLSEMDRKQEVLKEKLSKLGIGIQSIINKSGGGRSAIEEEPVNLLLLTADAMSAAIDVGYQSFKDSATFVVNALRSQFGDNVADHLDLRQLKGAYLFAKNGTSSEEEVFAFKSLDELLSEPKAKDSNSQEIDGIKSDTKPAKNPRKPRVKLPKAQVERAENVLDSLNLDGDLFAFAEDVIMPVTNSGMVSLEALHETPAEELTDSEAETYFDNLAADIIVQAEKEGIPDVDIEEETRIIEALAENVPAETIAEARSETRKPTHTINDNGVPVIRNGKVRETVDGKIEYDDSFEATPIQSEKTIKLGDETLSLETVFERLKSKSDSAKMRDLLKGHKDEARIMAINKGVGTNANQKHAPILQALIDLGRYSKENPRGFSMDC